MPAKREIARASMFFSLSCIASIFGVAAAGAHDLPSRLVIANPFPKIVAQAPAISFIAPGVTEGEYDLLTVNGPVIVHAIAVDLPAGDLHLGAVLANDRLISAGETVRSMALRTGAIAGINGDYFDINSTNQPLNILVRDGQLLHPPMQRYALAIDSSGNAQFEEFQAVPPDVVTAIGGGPLIVHNGQWFDDPDGPRGKEFTQPIPASGVATAPDGTLFLVQIDGNRPDRSVGVTRPEFAEVLRALGATEGMAFDGGGSSTLVARRLGDRNATVQNLPSDGPERRVADGLFVYSDAPTGEPARIAVQPQTIHALSGALVELRFAVTDTAGNFLKTLDALDTNSARAQGVNVRVMPSSIATIAGTTLIARHVGTAVVHVVDGPLASDLPVTVLDRPARIVITAHDTALNGLNLDPGQSMQLQARAYDRDGYLLALPSNMQWTATRGTISNDGMYTAGNGNASVSVRVSDVSASQRITVGHREIPFSFGTHLTFSTVPAKGPGQIVVCAACVQLAYDFSGNERAAYLHVPATLPRGTLGIAFDVQGDPTNAILRVKVTNAINESVLLTATRLDFTGWKHVVVHFPVGISQPVTLSAMYVLNGVGGTRVTAAGSVTLRNLHLLVPGG
jgi:exopolysaccharide biosynthesis protein